MPSEETAFVMTMRDGRIRQWMVPAETETGMAVPVEVLRYHEQKETNKMKNNVIGLAITSFYVIGRVMKTEWGRSMDDCVDTFDFVTIKVN
jgi:hypothetical protein